MTDSAISGLSDTTSKQELLQLEQRCMHLLRYHALDPDNPILAQDCAESCYRCGDFPQARAVIGRALEKQPENTPLLFLQAKIDIAGGDSGRAVERLRDLLARGVDSGGVRYSLAYALGLLEQPRAALDALEPHWERTCAEIPEAPLLKAKLQHHLGALEDAVATLRDFLETTPDHVEAHGDLALLLTDCHDYDGAAAHAQRALANGGEHYAALLAQGMVALARNDADSAKHIFEKTVVRREERGRSWLGLGLSDLARNAPARAEPALREAVRLMPRHLGAWNILAWTQIGLGELAEAERTLRGALELDDGFSASWGTLAVVQSLGGDTAAAQASIARALELQDSSFALEYAEGVLAAFQRDPQQGTAALQALLRHPAAGRTQALLAELQALQAQSGGHLLH